jgi:ADP-ribose pyrophosphatase
MDIKREKLWEKDGILVGKITFKNKEKQKTKQYIEMKNRVVLIVSYHNDNIVLLREYRHLQDEVMWRLPAGTLEEGEDPQAGAKRELLEETGFKAGKLTLVKKYEFMGWIKFPIFVYLATKLTKDDESLDFYEKINTETVTIDKAKELAYTSIQEPHHGLGLLQAINYIMNKSII